MAAIIKSAHAIDKHGIRTDTLIRITRHIRADFRHFHESRGRFHLTLDLETVFVAREILPREIDTLIALRRRRQIRRRARPVGQRRGMGFIRIIRMPAAIISANPIKISRVRRQHGIGKTIHLRADHRNLFILAHW